MSKPVILTGIRANENLQLGNYLGAILPMVDMANQKSSEFQVNMFVPDLHSFTTPIDHSKLQGQILNALKIFAAAGLPFDKPEVYIYRQSRIPAHSELTVILNSFTGMGEMSRMTQFKDKSAKLGNDRVSVGLFDYPVLMAADILLYRTMYVPVGADQTQHLEYTRDIAQRLNKKFDKDLFVVPKDLKKQHEFFSKDQGLRIRDLLNPLIKMSKSDESGKGVIYLNDSPDDAKRKILSATTDSVGKVQYDYTNQPGISNLLDIYKCFGGESEEFIGQAQYGPLKEALAEKVGDFLKEFQEKISQVNDEGIFKKLESSEIEMNKQANATLERVQKAVGLR